MESNPFYGHPWIVIWGSSGEVLPPSWDLVLHPNYVSVVLLLWTNLPFFSFSLIKSHLSFKALFLQEVSLDIRSQCPLWIQLSDVPGIIGLLCMNWLLLSVINSDATNIVWLCWHVFLKDFICYWKTGTMSSISSVFSAFPGTIFCMFWP